MEINRQVKNILIVARWPLGGIRTYLRYIFRHFPPNYKLTFIVASTQENAAISEDARDCNARLIIIKNNSSFNFSYSIFRELCQNNYHLILSQGFISAVAVSAANLLLGIPHILTIHGILEPKYLTGKFSKLKKWLLANVLKRITILYGVSDDILDHLYNELPSLQTSCPSIVIPNGIELSELTSTSSLNLRQMLKIDSYTFLFGFFGRFMHQKGFDLVIQAVDALRQQNNVPPFAVVAVGSGDYIRELQQEITNLKLSSYFHFLPFQPHVHQLYPQVDVIVAPSRWEACPLLPMEALCMGTPLIASDCIGLRETVYDTPTMTFPSENLVELVKLMRECMDNYHAEEFIDFVPHAKKRYDVSNSAQKLIQVIESIV